MRDLLKVWLICLIIQNLVQILLTEMSQKVLEVALLKEFLEQTLTLVWRRCTIVKTSTESKIQTQAVALSVSPVLQKCMVWYILSCYLWTVFLLWVYASGWNWHSLHRCVLCHFQTENRLVVSCAKNFCALLGFPGFVKSQPRQDQELGTCALLLLEFQPVEVNECSMQDNVNHTVSDKAQTVLTTSLQMMSLGFRLPICAARGIWHGQRPGTFDPRSLVCCVKKSSGFRLHQVLSAYNERIKLFQTLPAGHFWRTSGPGLGFGQWLTPGGGKRNWDLVGQAIPRPRGRGGGFSLSHGGQVYNWVCVPKIACIQGSAGPSTQGPEPPPQNIVLPPNLYCALNLEVEVEPPLTDSALSNYLQKKQCLSGEF